jgi:hypothetical protein
VKRQGLNHNHHITHPLNPSAASQDDDKPLTTNHPVDKPLTTPSAAKRCGGSNHPDDRP